MLYKLVKCYVVVVLFFCLQCHADKTVIRAAVADELKDGLHSKYLQYFADQLNVTLELTTMPLARRLEQIKSGELDIIVGIQKTAAREDEFTYIMPYYERLTYRIFALQKNENNIKSYQDLVGKYIGINRYAKYFKAFDENDAIYKFKATGVIQNIEMLLRERIDAFIHYEQSALTLLAQFDEENKITQVPYQPTAEVRHYLAISNHSVLMQRKNELQQIIISAIKNKDLLTIRTNYYTEMHQRMAIFEQ